jgi:uncharacterized membrane protein YheB (UPF0754 family)
MNKSIATNLISLALVVVGYLSPVYHTVILMTGWFALSGGITNWLAIHMLFEKVPFLYGSGVIPARFEEFKVGIKQLLIQEFFTRENVARFLEQNQQDSLSAISEQIDFDYVFEGLTDAIEASPLGGMLGMLGGKKALQPLKEPVTTKLQEIIADLVTDAQVGQQKDDVTTMLLSQVEQIIDSRLAELTPEKVKEIVQEMIRSHLGWLVVWGGVFGGLIGLVVSIVPADLAF